MEERGGVSTREQYNTKQGELAEQHQDQNTYVPVREAGRDVLVHVRIPIEEHAGDGIARDARDDGERPLAVGLHRHLRPIQPLAVQEGLGGDVGEPLLPDLATQSDERGLDGALDDARPKRIVADQGQEKCRKENEMD